MAGKKKQGKLNLEALEAEFGEIHSTAQNYCDQVAAQLNRVIEDAGVALGFPIQHRVKKWSSLVDKFERVSLRVKSVKEVQDLVGLRIVLLFDRDAQVVNKLIADKFNVVREYDTQDRLKEDQFGYSSHHFVVTLPEEWLEVPTLAQLGELQAEIQVRTLAQHIWAEASQSLQYKREQNVPATLLRPIYRVSALLETVDLEFERVLEQRETYRATVEVSQTDEALNVDLLEKLLDSLLPERNKEDPEQYAELLRELAYFGIKGPGQVEDMIVRRLDTALSNEEARISRERINLAEGLPLIGTSEERTNRGVFFTHSGLLREVLRAEFGNDQVSNAMEELGTGSS